MMAALATTVMSLGDLLGSTAGVHSAIEITDLVLDSRQVTRGSAFIALAGTRKHGLCYAEEALSRGAAIIIYEPTPDYGSPPEFSVPVAGLGGQLGELARKFFWCDFSPQVLAGVTGTNGKSTVAYLIAQAMNFAGMACGYVGTLGYGIPPDLKEHGLTTPDCLTLHREVRSLQSPHVAVEVSSHALAQERISGLEIPTAVFTNLSRDHLDYHGDLTSYRRAKAKLFQRPGLAQAVLNVDDPFATTLINRLPPNVTKVGVSTGDSSADLFGQVTHADMNGITVQVSGRHGSGLMESRLVGNFNSENLLLALGVLLAWDVAIADGCEALSFCRTLPGRMEVFGGSVGAPWVIVDYAHSPAALERALSSVSNYSSAETWCVFGCGGERDPGKRPLMGAVAARLADHIVLTDDNPRGEDPSEIVAQIRTAITSHPHVIVEHDRGRAILDTIGAAASGDTVLIAGKGHEVWQKIGQERRPFSDRAVVEAAVGERQW
ncbi:MAG: UDP-N-acetylmuramoyl-L-alanyl-D-glutamate--2,6-diaminopimelate ligase [Gammaproteobacteria bacterium]